MNRYDIALGKTPLLPMTSSVSVPEIAIEQNETDPTIINVTCTLSYPIRHITLTGVVQTSDLS